jgi:hypothetical protein
MLAPMTAGSGVATWSSAAWLECATAWIDARLAAAGLERIGELEQPRTRPWAAVLRVPTSGGLAWMKAAGPATAFEAALYALLAEVTPGRVLTPIALDAERGWLLLPDGGDTLGGRMSGEAQVLALADALALYGRLQRDLMPHADALLSLGVADMRPAVMPDRFSEALRAVGDGAEDLAAMAPEVREWCSRLEASPIPASLDHNDLHPFNVLAEGLRFYDWGDSVVAHPFAVALVPLGIIRRGLDEPGFIAARDAYLAVFSDLAPHAELVETLELACRVAKIARALIWDRALLTAREQGEETPEEWASAPLETLTSIRDESYLLEG